MAFDAAEVTAFVRDEFLTAQATVFETVRAACYKSPAYKGYALQDAYAEKYRNSAAGKAKRAAWAKANRAKGREYARRHRARAKTKTGRGSPG